MLFFALRLGRVVMKAKNRFDVLEMVQRKQEFGWWDNKTDEFWKKILQLRVVKFSKCVVFLNPKRLQDMAPQLPSIDLAPRKEGPGNTICKF